MYSTSPIDGNSKVLERLSLEMNPLGSHQDVMAVMAVMDVMDVMDVMGVMGVMARWRLWRHVP